MTWHVYTYIMIHSPNVGFLGQSSAIWTWKSIKHIFRLHLNIVYIDFFKHQVKKKNVGIYTVSIGKMVREIVGNTFSFHIISKMISTQMGFNNLFLLVSTWNSFWGSFFFSLKDLCNKCSGHTIYIATMANFTCMPKSYS